ncbi:MAG: iron-containing redox enzyme family protein [Mycobacteriales bacterium]
MTLHERLIRALDGADPTDLGSPVDRRDRFLALHAIYDLHLAPLEQVGDRARFQHRPDVSGLKATLEQAWLAELETDDTDLSEHDLHRPDGVRDALRDLASRDRLPASYDWLAREATWEQLVQFLALEGGPDGGFDDLVALCQVGLAGSAKLELAQNYWDEMGNGDAAAVHTVLHQDLARAAGLPVIPREELPVEALERGALNGLLATNRWLQPELVGALGMTELQAGPRCRRVLQGLERLGAPLATVPFYDEHARVDPRHGADWVEKAVMPLVAEHPTWGPRIVRGAIWRARTNLALFAVAHDLAAAWSPQRLAG